MAPTPYSGIYGTKKPRKPGSTANPNDPRYGAGSGYGSSTPFAPGTGWGSYTGTDPSNPGIWSGRGQEDWIIDPEVSGQGFVPPPPGGATPGGPAGEGSRWFTGERPDYSGILNQYKQGWENRLRAGIANMEIRRQSQAKGLINRLGVRDPQAMLAKLSKYGITAADLEQAKANPFSDLKAIERNAELNRGRGFADLAGRSGFRSGGSTFVTQEVANQAARDEAMRQQETQEALDRGIWEKADYEMQGWDEIDQRSAELEGQLAQAYQPETFEAHWDPGAGGYRAPNGKVYNERGQVIG